MKWEGFINGCWCSSDTWNINPEIIVSYWFNQKIVRKCWGGKKFCLLLVNWSGFFFLKWDTLIVLTFAQTDTSQTCSHIHDWTSLVKNRCTFPLLLPNSFIIEGGVSIFGFVLSLLTFNTSHWCLLEGQVSRSYTTHSSSLFVWH